MVGRIKGEEKFMHSFVNFVCIYFHLKKIVFMHIFYRIRGLEKQFSFYKRTKKMEEAKVSYSREKEVIGMHLIMENDET